MAREGDVDVSVVAALFADSGRARILLALLDGRALPASVLAAEAGVSAPATSSAPGTARRRGLARPRPVRSLRAHTRAAALRRDRSCSGTTSCAPSRGSRTPAVARTTATPAS